MRYWNFAALMVVLVWSQACQNLLEPTPPVSGSDPLPPPHLSVVYDANGATEGEVPVDEALYYPGDETTVLGNTGALVKPGFTFAGWITEGGGAQYSPGTTVPLASANLTLFAHWTNSPTFTVTYEKAHSSDGGAVPVDSNLYVAGAAVPVAANTEGLTRAGSTFIGWLRYTDEGSVYDGYYPGETFPMPASNLILYAVWTTNPTFRVTYHPNGASSGTVPLDANDYGGGSSVSVKGNPGHLAKPGATFAGWALNPEGSGSVYGNGTPFYIYNATVLYARWVSQTTHTILYEGTGAEAGTAPVDFGNYLEGGQARILANIGGLQKTGHQVAGWNTKPDGSGTSFALGAIHTVGSSDLVLYPIWLDEKLTFGGSGNRVSVTGKNGTLSAVTTIAEGVTNIDNYALQNAVELTEVILPSTLDSIYSGAFKGCLNLETLALPAGVNFVTASAFEGCAKLTQIAVQAGNRRFQSIDGVLFNRDSAGVHLFPPGRGGAYTLPSVIPGDVPVTVTTVGGDSFRYSPLLTEVTLPATVTTIGYSAFQGAAGLQRIHLPASLLTIGNYAFMGCTNLDQVVIPGSVDGIGPSAFKNCTGLTSIVFPNATLRYLEIEAFAGCTALTAIEFPPSLTQIRDGAFLGCTGLVSVTLPATLLTLGGWVFQNCTSLETAVLEVALSFVPTRMFSGCVKLSSVVLPSSLTQVGPEAFRGCEALTSLPTLPSGVTRVSSQAFSGTGITALTLPPSVIFLESGAFAFCPNLASVSIEGSVSHLGDSLFSNCPQLVSVSIPSGTTATLGSRTFFDCTALTTVTLPASLKVFRSQAFAGTEALTQLTLPAGLQSLQDRAFAGTALTSLQLPASLTTLGKEVFANSKLTSMTLPASLTSLGTAVFSGSQLLTSVTFQGTLAALPESTFLGCSGLTAVGLPAGMTSIGFYAFEACTSLPAIMLPASVNLIGFMAFSGCISLSSIVCLSSAPPAFTVFVEGEIPESVEEIRVPAAAVAAYQTAPGWQDFADLISAL